MKTSYIKEKYRIITAEDCHGIEPIKYLFSDEESRDFWGFKCPEDGCCNFFSARADSVEGGKTRSCGCRKRSACREIGLSNRKTNTVYHPLGYDFGICFYDNVDDYFIFDEGEPLIEKYHWYARPRKDKTNALDAYARLENGTVRAFSRLVMNTPDDMQADHVNRNTADNRAVNLRNGTNAQNNFNKITGQGEIYHDKKSGKFKIRKFSKEDTSNLFFETEEEALSHLQKLQNKYFGEFSFRRSQEIAKENETNQFVNLICSGVLDEINSLPKRNVAKIILTNITRDLKNERISEDMATDMLIELMHNYRSGYFD